VNRAEVDPARISRVDATAGATNHRPHPTDPAMTEQAVPAAHLALQLGKHGRIPGDEMLRQLSTGHLVVPLSEPPTIEDGAITTWKPATASRADGSQWLIAFTTPELAFAYCRKTPDYGHCMTVETNWVLLMLPSGLNLVLNPNSPYMLEWDAESVARYTKDVLGW
jgi:hypothetical protein